MITVTSTAKTSTTGERADLLESLAKHRYFLRYTVRDLTDEQAVQRTTASELCLGGLVKHVSDVERVWADFIVRGTDAVRGGPADGTGTDNREKEFTLRDDETLADVLDRYAKVGHRTDEIVASLPDLDISHPLPKAPWFEPGSRWSARRVLLHIIGETAQHAGHADIIREALDGSKSMG
ncbi:DinB family protein [Rhodococcus sp. WB9]|uniref:DinB family protein n=1 Tax=Rhodococcus sp. WB9 TaxID=2594007 RepID=UPI0011854E23|nr:DinB family protein [Rhodococcus sp. WB9]QDQ94742.1 DinB family protein [Rhodococcus sp. WB9]